MKEEGHLHLPGSKQSSDACNLSDGTELGRTGRSLQVPIVSCHLGLILGFPGSVFTSTHNSDDQNAKNSREIVKLFLVRFYFTIKIDLPAGWLEMSRVFSNFYQVEFSAEHSLGLE